MKVTADESSSSCAFGVYLRDYVWGFKDVVYRRTVLCVRRDFDEYVMGNAKPKVGRCRLTVSKPVLKAPMVSAKM